MTALTVSGSGRFQSRPRLLLVALGVSLLLHGGLIAALFLPTSDPSDGPGGAVIVELVATDGPQTVRDSAADPAPEDIAAPARPEREPLPEPATAPPRISRPDPAAPVVLALATLALIAPAAGPPLSPQISPRPPVGSDVVALSPSFASLDPAFPLPEAKPPVEPVSVAPPPAAGTAVDAVPGESEPEPRAPGPSETTGGTAEAVSHPSESPALSGTAASALPASAPAPSAQSVAFEAPPPVALFADGPPRYDLAVLDNPMPDYPRLARRRGQEGRAVVLVAVLPNGAPETVELRTSSGYSLLDEAALAAIRQWRFAPAIRRGVAARETVVVPVVFRLD